MLVSCAVYVSSGLASVASRVAAAAAAVPRVAVVDTFTDVAYARSSVKLVAEPQQLLHAAEAAAAAALEVVDLSAEVHPAPHPRQGAVDMVSFMPLTERCVDAIRHEIEKCDELAWALGQRMGEVHGVPVLMYGPRAGRTLLVARRGTSFFRSTKADSARQPTASLALDFGEGAMSPRADAAEPMLLPPRTGASVIGVQPYVTNFNVQVDGATLEGCKQAAAALRSEMGVQVMALPHAGGSHEIGCNLQAAEHEDSPNREAVLAFLRGKLPPSCDIPRAYVVGLTPDEARSRAEELLRPAGG